MESHIVRDAKPLNKIYSRLIGGGPLMSLGMACRFLQNHYKGMPGSSLLLRLYRSLLKLSYHFDKAFDDKYGTDTSGLISLEDLKINSDNINDGHWYEPLSAKVFNQLMKNVEVDFKFFEFIDFGSGKGRVLLLSSRYGFKKIIGVEFAKELNAVAKSNVAIYERYNRKESNIEIICMDAVQFPLPVSPLVIFFYSPFKGKVMEQVLTNIKNSLDAHPRKILPLFYGKNPETLKQFFSMGFVCTEVDIRHDWYRSLPPYRGFVFVNSG